jgi:hypothetical protein
MKKGPGKIALNRETLLQLQGDEAEALGRAGGGTNTSYVQTYCSCTSACSLCGN